MKINTCYTVMLKNQIVTDGSVVKTCRVDERVMKATRMLCLDALKFCTEAFLSEWEYLKAKTGVERKRYADVLVHSTKNSVAKYTKFDECFPYMPSNTRRAIISDALGIVSSYLSSLTNWELMNKAERGDRPTLGYPSVYELTFYKEDRRLSLDSSTIQLKLYNGSEWKWYSFGIGKSDADYIAKMAKTRKILSPTVEKIHGRYYIRFCFEERRDLVQNESPLDYTVMAVDLGINAPASWCIMTSDGSVHARGVVHLACDEDRLRHMINRKRMFQQNGKRSHSMYRMVNSANRQLSINTAKAIMDIAVLYSVDCIVFEHLDKNSKVKGKKYRERIHMWNACDVQERVTLQAHRLGMRISRICAWNTSRLAFDGSGITDRQSVYHYVHGKKKYNYSLCTFTTGKIYNCDINASYNIGARFFLREYAKLSDCPELPKTPYRTLATLKELTKVYNGSIAA